MIYVTLADGFEEIEAIEPIDILRRAGLQVVTASVMESKQVTGAHGMKLEADILINDVDPDAMELLILPGGGGYQLLDASNEVHALINYALIHNKHIAAICAAPSILGKKQLLFGKRVTCYPGYEDFCYGAEITGAKVITDGRITTGRGPGAAADFGFELVAIMTDTTKALELKDTMQYND